MKMSLQIGFSLCISVLLVALLFIPQESWAQRLNHPNYSHGGGGSRPPAAPSQNISRSEPATPAYRPATVVNRPAPAPAENHPAQPVVNRPSQPSQQIENRATINGGSYNTGNHYYNQNMERPPVNTYKNPGVQPHENVTVQRNVSVHENVNVYHNHYQPAHAYAYHPYHPYYWGHNWHPLGYFAVSLAQNVFLLSIANQQYYYDEGVYYQPATGGYAVITAPLGAIVNSLPPGYETTMVGNDYYYYYGGTFYIDTGNGYQVVQAPFGAVVTQIPDGAVQQDINGQTYLFYSNTYYQPVSLKGVDAYEVVQVN
jgi:Family of unknown function (DUF6515)